ncbi:MAG: hypothetical protein FJ045_05095 [Crenarchaeota archaeon]|nr:hypothetical protein [Thermoproteota archaeon]
MIEGIFGLIGIIIGFILSEAVNLLRQKRSEEEGIRQTRLLLKLEVEQNLSMLKPAHDRMSHRELGTTVGLADFAKALKEIPVPVFTHSAWNSLITSTAKSLSEQEIRKAAEFHARLEQLRDIHSEIQRYKKGITGKTDVALARDYRNTLQALLEVEDLLLDKDSYSH